MHTAISSPGQQHPLLFTSSITGTIQAGFSSPAASSATVTQLSPQASSYFPPQTSTWNSATVVTVTLAAAALFIAILALMLKHRRELEVAYQRTATSKFGEYFQSIRMLGTGNSTIIRKGWKRLIAMVGTGFQFIKRKVGY
ncbi:hypothetical protein BDD12DRAFT_805590 [Trichophaea hybrida]|nr:hypothetical protein BDD12DRAFT_805590 [Trichophaea hybrida]